ncbi:MAG: glutamate-cysteine ligase family protein [bacterium]|nr:glutamate-cysteine ligase family protein [bacterium]
MEKLKPSRAERFDEQYPFFRVMREEFRRIAEGIMNGSIVTSHASEGRRVGVELEFSCITKDGSPLSEAVRNRIVDENPKYQQELGAAQIEIMTPPIFVTASKGFSALRDSMHVETQRLVQILAQNNALVVRFGADPIVPLTEAIRTRGKERYLTVPNFHQRNLRKGLPIQIGRGAGLVPCDQAIYTGAMSSVQYNLDCHSPEEALALLNYSLGTGPYAVALGANARFFGGVDTGLADIRAIVWEFSHDIRTAEEVSMKLSGRTGLPTNYYGTLSDYFQEIYDQPSILNDVEHAFDRGCGLYWRDTRIKFLKRDTPGAQIVLEFRPLSLQPSCIEDYAMLAFSLGHTYESYIRGLPLLPMAYLHDNRWAAMEDGINGNLWMFTKSGHLAFRAARDVLREQTVLAKDGLKRLGASNAEICEAEEIWKERLMDGCPSDLAFIRLRDRWAKRTMGNKPIDHELLREELLANTNGGL